MRLTFFYHQPTSRGCGDMRTNYQLIFISADPASLDKVFECNWHVGGGMHCSWALHFAASFSRLQWGWSIIQDLFSAWYTWKSMLIGFTFYMGVEWVELSRWLIITFSLSTERVVRGNCSGREYSVSISRMSKNSSNLMAHDCSARESEWHSTHSGPA